MASESLFVLFELLKPYIGSNDREETTIQFEGLRLWACSLYPQCRFVFDSIIPLDTKLLVRSRADEDEDESVSIIPATLTSYAVVGTVLGADGMVLAKGISSPMRLHNPEDETDCPDWTIKKLEEAWRHALSTLGISEQKFWSQVEDDKAFLDKLGILSYSPAAEPNKKETQEPEQRAPTETSIETSMESGKSLLFKASRELWLELKNINGNAAKESLDAYCAHYNIAQRVHILDEEGLLKLIEQLNRQIKAVS